MTMELHDKYPFVCPFCGVIAEASPSLFMQMGINEGSGRCLCGERLFFKINDDNSRFDVITTEEHYCRTLRSSIL